MILENEFLRKLILPLLVPFRSYNFCSKYFFHKFSYLSILFRLINKFQLLIKIWYSARARTYTVFFLYVYSGTCTLIHLFLPLSPPLPPPCRSFCVRVCTYILMKEIMRPEKILPIPKNGLRFKKDCAYCISKDQNR